MADTDSAPRPKAAVKEEARTERAGEAGVQDVTRECAVPSATPRGPPSRRQPQARRDPRAASGHPWIFRSDVAARAGVPRAPSSASSARPAGRWASRSSRASEIRLRMVERGDTPARRPSCATGSRPRAPGGDTVAPASRPAASSTAKATGCPRWSWTATASTSSSRRCRRPPSALKARDRGRARRASSSRAGSWSATTRACARSRGSPQQVGVLHGEVPETVTVARERRALRGRPLARPEDGPLPRPAREPRHGPRLRSRARPRRLHLQRRLRPPGGGAGRRGPGRRRLRGSGGARAAQRRPQRDRQRDRARGQRLRPAARARRPRRALRHRDPRPARLRQEQGARWRRRAAATRRSTCAP